MKESIEFIENNVIEVIKGYDSISVVDAVTSSGILKAKQKLGRTFNSDKHLGATTIQGRQLFKGGNYYLVGLFDFFMSGHWT